MAKAIDHARRDHCGGILGDKMMTKRMMPIVKPKVRKLKTIKLWRSFQSGVNNVLCEWKGVSHYDGVGENYTIFGAYPDQEIVGEIRLAPGDWLTVEDPPL